MDAPGLPEDEVADAYRVLRRVNRQFFGGNRPMGRELDRFRRGANLASRSITLLDVGSGSGDLAGLCASRCVASGIEATAISLDRDPTAVALSSRSGLPSVMGDALRLPFADGSVDLVTAVKFAHHFHGPELVRLVSEMARVARRRVIVLDIRRHWLAYWGFVAWSHVFTRNRLVRHDGPLSVLRGFTREELLEATAGRDNFRWEVRGYGGFQLALVGIRTI